MNNYQLTIVLKNTLDDKARKGLLDDVTKSFGKLIKEDLWGIRSLAYPIKHQDRAYFAFYEFESEPKNIPSLDKSVKLNEDIIRYLLIKAKPVSKAKRAAKKAKNRTILAARMEEKKAE